MEGVADVADVESSNSSEAEEFVDDRPNSKNIVREHRAAVSAEAVGEWNKNDEEWIHPKHDKTSDRIARLEDLLHGSFLFGSLDKTNQGIVIDAMEQFVCDSSNQQVITQGDDGDFLFVVEQGTLVCFKKDSPDTVLKTCFPGDVFGELALLYNAPRAASVRTVGPCVLWKLGRRTFTHIVRDGASAKRDKHLEFLKSVSILSNLGSYEIGQLADALNPQTFSPYETIVVEGDLKADIFYILESGTVDAYKSGIHVMNYTKPGDYFGELALIKDEPRAATVKAGFEGCTVLLLYRDAFKRLLGDLEDLVQKQYD